MQNVKIHGYSEHSEIRSICVTMDYKKKKQNGGIECTNGLNELRKELW